MGKIENISILLSILKKIGLNKSQLIENEKILIDKNNIDIENLLKEILELLNKQKELDKNILYKIKKINLDFEENIENQNEKIYLDNNINF